MLSKEWILSELSAKHHDHTDDGTPLTAVSPSQRFCCCRMQSIGGLGSSDAQQQATIEATLRLKTLSAEEAEVQGALVIGLRFTIWEPMQAVRPLTWLCYRSADEPVRLIRNGTRRHTFVILSTSSCDLTASDC